MVAPRAVAKHSLKSKGFQMTTMASSLAHLEENLAAGDVVLDEAALADLNALDGS